MKYRTALNVCFAVVTALWIGWCLYWPFTARDRDLRDVLREADETYKVCLQQPAVTAADCRTDRNVYVTLMRKALAPTHANAYQLFAGRRMRDAFEFMAILCLLPPLIVFALLRIVLEAYLYLARLRRHDLGLSR